MSQAEYYLKRGIDASFGDHQKIFTLFSIASSLSSIAKSLSKADDDEFLETDLDEMRDLTVVKMTGTKTPFFMVKVNGVWHLLSSVKTKTARKFLDTLKPRVVSVPKK